MKELLLINSKKVALVDDEDFQYVFLYNWKLTGGKYVTGSNLDMHNKYLHHVIADLIGLVITETVDHRDRNPLNNTRINLRAATYTENLLNRSLTKLSASGERFIVWSGQKQKWQVEINTTNYREHVGFYDTVADAIVARDEFLRNLTKVL